MVKDESSLNDYLTPNQNRPPLQLGDLLIGSDGTMYIVLDEIENYTYRMRRALRHVGKTCVMTDHSVVSQHSERVGLDGNVIPAHWE